MKYVAGLLVALAVIGTLFWLLASPDQSPPVAATPSANADSGADASAARGRLAPTAPITSTPASVRSPSNRSDLGLTEEPLPAASAPPAEPESFYPVVLTCVRGDRRPLDRSAVSFVLTRVSDSKQIEFYSSNSNTAAGEIPLGVWRVQASTVGYRHVAAKYDFTDIGKLEHSPGASAPAFVANIYLWPDHWIPVIARIPNGQSLADLAREHGLESEKFLISAFRLRTSPFEHMMGLGVPGMENGPLCRLHPPQRWQKAVLPGSVIGSLEILQPQPFWIWLELFQAQQHKQLLTMTDREVIFDLDGDDLEGLRGRVTCRVVTRGSRIPISGARASLIPELIAHRNEDYQDLESDEQGRIKFTGVLPGRYELQITHGDHKAWRHLLLRHSPNEILGDIHLGRGVDVPVRVVDEDGKPAPGVIEVAPFVPGGFVAELYHLDESRTTEADATYTLPLPDGPSIVRARPTQLRGPKPDHRMFETRSFYLDPDDPPDEIVLVAQLPVEVTFDVTQARIPWEDGQLLEFLPPMGRIRSSFVVHRVLDPSVPIHVVPGSYHIRRWEGGQEIISQGSGIGVGPMPTTYTLR